MIARLLVGPGEWLSEVRQIKVPSISALWKVRNGVCRGEGCLFCFGWHCGGWGSVRRRPPPACSPCQAACDTPPSFLEPRPPEFLGPGRGGAAAGPPGNDRSVTPNGPALGRLTPTPRAQSLGSGGTWRSVLRPESAAPGAGGLSWAPRRGSGCRRRPVEPTRVLGNSEVQSVSPALHLPDSEDGSSVAGSRSHEAAETAAALPLELSERRLVLSKPLA